VLTTRLPRHTSVFTSYTDCVKRGGQLLSYDNAIQFSACKGNANLYLQYSAQDMPRLTAEKTQSTANMVVAGEGISGSLVSFLKYDYTGCDKNGYYEVLKEVPGRFAEVSYGCSVPTSQSAQSYMIAMYTGGAWTFISPTNNMNGSVPSCLLVDMFKVSKELTSRCYQNTGYNDGSLRAVDYP
jgi:hypothetical protein